MGVFVLEIAGELTFRQKAVAFVSALTPAVETIDRREAGSYPLQCRHTRTRVPFTLPPPRTTSGRVVLARHPCALRTAHPPSKLAASALAAMNPHYHPYGGGPELTSPHPPSPDSGYHGHQGAPMSNHGRMHPANGHPIGTIAPGVRGGCAPALGQPPPSPPPPVNHEQQQQQ
ncbi:unnamed protein product [Phaedon cochleariae]|uniref:Uncharacterized protein n=1 Tax=Phaedon cochleariae TaxID=80249 RepID=A0A9N9WXY5_PHACE|nr:unnamed protein product [Phaedon cochleariae]